MIGILFLVLFVMFISWICLLVLDFMDEEIFNGVIIAGILAAIIGVMVLDDKPKEESTETSKTESKATVTIKIREKDTEALPSVFNQESHSETTNIPEIIEFKPKPIKIVPLDAVTSWVYNNSGRKYMCIISNNVNCYRVRKEEGVRMEHPTKHISIPKNEIVLNERMIIKNQSGKIIGCVKFNKCYNLNKYARK